MEYLQRPPIELDNLVLVGDVDEDLAPAVGDGELRLPP